jgi:hypothetical protein
MAAISLRPTKLTMGVNGGNGLEANKIDDEG